jgi:predicted nucleotidyltransferase
MKPNAGIEDFLEHEKGKYNRKTREVEGVNWLYCREKSKIHQKEQAGRAKLGL